MKPSLHKTLATAKDLSEQPASSAVLILSGGVAFIAIDAYEIHDGVFEGYRQENGSRVRVVSFPAESSWITLKRSITDEFTREEYIRAKVADIDHAEALEKELGLPSELAPDVAEYMKRVQGDGTGTGQYL